MKAGKKKVVADPEEEGGVDRRTVPLELITKHPEMHYRPLDKEWADELSADIENNGLDVPLIVWNEDGDTQVKIAGELHPASFLIAGLHRQEALKRFRARNPKGYEKMFPEGIPVVFKTGDMADALTAQLRENVQRKDMTAEEIFPVIERLQDDFGLKGKEIAKRIGKSTAWVSNVMQIKEQLGDEGVEGVIKKGVTMSDAAKAARKLKKAKKAGKKVSVSEVLKGAKSKAAKKKKKGAQRAEKRISAKTAYKRFLALPKMKLHDTIELLTETLAYLAGEEEEPPDLIAEEPESETEE
jgi:ParB-like chromosome segregation protein Spo0J